MEATVTQSATVDISALANIVVESKDILSKGYRMVSAYKEEQSINNDYRGRQLLELIQNADDAGSAYVSISLDTESRILRIENEGDPFTTEGYRSLMIPNLSSKRKKKYIGNKGLGFRSILNWSNKVTINSGGVVVVFSRELAQSWFENLYPEEAQRLSVLAEFQYPAESTPFPIFSIPDITPIEEVQPLTTIEIDYLDEPEIVNDIVSQLRGLQEEVLLFLNNINRISFSINGDPIEFARERKENSITINEKTWQIYDNKINANDPEVPAEFQNNEILEAEVYSLKIAVRAGLRDKGNNLFCFFPTKINVNFPMIIHGTFELDSSRNRITDTPKNKFLIGKLIDLIFEVSDDFFPGESSWDKMRLFNYGENKNAVLEKDFSFYKLIEDRLKNLPVFPALDGSYKSYANIKYHNNDFPTIIRSLEVKKQFPELLQTIPSDLTAYITARFPDYSYNKRYNDSVLRSKIETASKDLLERQIDSSIYARWITSLNNIFIHKSSPLSILYNDDYELIDKGNTIYTPPTQSSFIDIPDHVKIDYINKDLANKLYAAYSLSKDDRSRKLKDKLDNFTNIQSFEPAPVLTKIITATNEVIRDKAEIAERKEIVKNTIHALYKYYCNSPRARESQIRTENIPIISSTGEVVLARDSFLSAAYRTGSLRLELLGDIYTAKQQVAEPDSLGIENSEIVEDFLTNFLGVNKFVKIEFYTSTIDTAYRDFAFSVRGAIGYRDMRITGSRIGNLPNIVKNIRDKSLTRENLVAWIYSDDETRTLLQSTTDTKFRYSVSYDFKDTYNHALTDSPSYVKFQLQGLKVFDDFLLNDMDVPFINDFKFDFDATCFRSKNVSESAINGVLLSLGAKSDFKELNIKRIEKILKTLKDVDPTGKNARKVYQAAIDKFNKDGLTLPSYSNLELHAVKNGIKQYLPYQSVFYSNKIGLPRKVLAENGILNYPRRAGEQSIYKFLKVSNFDNIDYSVDSYVINEKSTSILYSYLKVIKPFILTTRLQKVSSDIKGAVNAVKSIQLNLCGSLSYKAENELNTEVYDFVRLNLESNTFLILAPEYNSKDELLSDSDLSDVISEIFTIVFDVVNIEDDIRFIFRNNVRDTEHQIKKRYGDEALAYARSKLEITEAEEKFWKCVFELMNIENLPEIDDESDFRENIALKLGIDQLMMSKIDYASLTADGNVKLLVELFSKCKISFEAFNAQFGCSISLLAYHRYKLATAIERLKEDFKICLWSKFKTESADIRRQFIHLISAFNLDMFRSIAEEHTYKTVDSYEQLIDSVVFDNMGLKIISHHGSQPPYKAVFTKNRMEIAPTDEQFRDLSEEDKSLLYFEMDENALAQFKERVKPKQDTQPSPVPSPVTPSPISKPTPSKPIVPLKPSGSRRGTNRSGGNWSSGGNYSGGGYTGDEDKERQELGRRSEIEVFEALKKKYPNGQVEWVSEYSDYYVDKGNKWGYDIKYRISSEAEWYYVEVKSFYKGCFFFTTHELNTAIDNQNTYYIFLVDDDKISEIQFNEFLNNEGELILENCYFSIKVNDYKFTKP